MFKFEKVEINKGFYKGDSQITLNLLMREIGLDTKVAIEEAFMDFLDDVYKKLQEADRECRN